MMATIRHNAYQTHGGPWIVSDVVGYVAMFHCFRHVHAVGRVPLLLCRELVCGENLLDDVVSHRKPHEKWIAVIQVRATLR